jgi:putative ABC transport system ATP-binding protein
MKLVRVENVSKSYQLGQQTVQALKDINLTVDDGEFLAIAGPSGSGKSTLLNLIGCIDTPTSGTLTIGSQSVNGRTADELADLRARSIGFVFQTFNLLPVLTAAENVEYPLYHFPELSRAERASRVAQYLEVVGLEKHGHHRPNELSGGQRQRVAIARALATRPRIILADEPTANLDHSTGGSVLELMKEINRSQKTTFIFSTHDPSVMDMADRIVEVNDGMLTERGIFRTWDVREDLAALEASIEHLLHRAFDWVPAEEIEKEKEQIRISTRGHPAAETWADQTLTK